MNVEYTGRQIEITPDMRKQVEQGLKKLIKLIGDNFESKVVLTVEKHRNVADITVTSPNRNPIVGLAEAKDMSSAVDEALDRIERQLLKNKGRWRNLKRQPKKTWAEGEARPEELQLAVGMSASAAVPVAVHSFPARPIKQEAHIVKTTDAIALRPMTVEEAVKEAEFRDRHVFVFHDKKSGRTTVLHRRMDGKVELIEVP
ncbi:MAG: ribosome hibernation-promoting factor, HPF/YfiA family [Terriglobales bacterium]